LQHVRQTELASNIQVIRALERGQTMVVEADCQPEARLAISMKAGSAVMVLGVGVDIVSISRVKDAVETAGKVFLDKVFTAQEQQRAETHADPVAYLAMVFAGKEAIFKTFALSWETGVQLTEIEVKHGEFGEPTPILAGKFAELASQRGAAEVLLSLSYDGDYAVAVATLVGVQQHITS
jgi:holo-[acyl-carrier protein] synthase